MAEDSCRELVPAAAMHPRPWPEPRVHPDAWVAETAVLIGDVQVEAGASLWPTAVARGDVCPIVIGPGSNVQDGAVLHGDPDQPVTIGADVTIGHRAVVHGATLEDGCLIGIGAIVLDGVEVQSDVIIGAGSVVTPGKLLESGYLYVGSPARRSRELTQAERERIPKMARDYVTLKNEYAGE